MFRSGLGLLRYVRLLAPVAAAIVAAGGGVVAVSRATDSTQSQPPVGPAERQGLALQSAFVKVVSSISPSVVQIEDQRGLGSGIVLDKAGHIVTNNHVVSGAKAFTVTTLDGKRYRVRLVGSLRPMTWRGSRSRVPTSSRRRSPTSPNSGSAISRSRSATRSGCGRA